jgi:hypothetical protein
MYLHNSYYPLTILSRVPFAHTEVTAGMGIKFASTYTATTGIELREAGAARIFTTVVDGYWAVSVEEAGGPVIYKSDKPHKSNVWEYIEIRASFNNFSLRVDGQTAIPDTAISMTGSVFDQVLLYSAGSSSFTSYGDDFYLWDGPEFKGPIIIQPLTLTQVGDNAFIPGGTDNPTTVAEAVDETLSDFGDSYASTSSPNIAQKFTAAPFDQNVKAIVLTLNGSTEDYGNHGISMTDGDRESDAVSLLEDQYQCSHAFREDLGDGSPLTAAGAEAQEYGFVTRVIS